MLASIGCLGCSVADASQKTRIRLIYHRPLVLGESRCNFYSAMDGWVRSKFVVVLCLPKCADTRNRRVASQMLSVRMLTS